MIAWFLRLSTAIKMLLILAVALFPLGLVAVLASLDAARDGQAARVAHAQARADQQVRSIASHVDRNMFLAGLAAGPASASLRDDPCRLFERARALNPALFIGRYEVRDRAGRSLCDARLGLAPARTGLAAAPGLTLDAARRELRFTAAIDAGTVTAVSGALTLRAVAHADRDAGMTTLELVDGRDRITLLDAHRASVLQNTIVSQSRLPGSNISVIATTGSLPVSASEIVTILLPLLMWLAAALLGWLVVDRLLLRPIKAMQKAVLAYRPGRPTFSNPHIRTPATEIRDLGEAFARVTRTIAAHESDLEAAIARQARLVREVHHRVKNNLQVIASLINIHARGARSPEAADAYSSIQRRVDALAVVHRNHYAELDDDRGIALRSLLSELTGNLRATAPPQASGMAITLDIDQVRVNQDVAVAVAFLVTEIVENAMFCAPDDPVTIAVTATDKPLIARFRLQSAGLKDGVTCDRIDQRQFERITIGLSRQMRAELTRDGEGGTYSIDVAIQAEAQAPA